MTLSFYIGASAMVLLAGTLLAVLPRLWRRDLLGETTIDWLRLRRSELEKEPSELSRELLTDAELRVVEELPSDVVGDHSDTSAKRRGTLTLFLLVTIAVVPLIIYQWVGSLDDVLITRQLETIADSSAQDIPKLISVIEERSAERPENSDYLSLLGQYYTGQEMHSKALSVYEQLLRLFPESPEILALSSQAEYLSLNRTLTDSARRRAEAALAANPGQRTALGTLGMAAFEAQDYGAALVYWQRLIEFEAPGSPGYQMMSSVIAEAKARGGVDAPPASADGVSVSVALPERGPDLNGVPDPIRGTVFVIARPAGSEARMPTAVVRRPAAELPFTVRLDDQSSMAGQKLSALEAVDIEIQLSPSGQPGRASATWVATVENVIPSADATVSVVLRVKEAVSE